MIRDDFLTGQLKKLAELLAALLGLTKEGKLDEAWAGLDRAYLSYVGMRRSMVDRLDVSSLVIVLGADKARMALQLLQTEAGILAAQGQDGRDRLARAARLRDLLGIAQDGSGSDPAEGN